jgi:hypothetical protein
VNNLTPAENAEMESLIEGAVDEGRERRSQHELNIAYGRIRSLVAEFDQANSDRQREHDMRVRLAGELESMTGRMQRTESQAEQLLTRIRDLEAELNEAHARQMALVYHVPGYVTAGSIQDARKAWLDLQSKAGRLDAAANAVLRVHMPLFGDSRTVDDCLVALAAAVAGVNESVSKDAPSCCHNPNLPVTTLSWMGSTPDINKSTHRYFCGVCKKTMDLDLNGDANG